MSASSDDTQTAATGADPVETNPGLYRVVFENERVRVLEYRDRPGDLTTPHEHPDSVMVTLSGFSRRLRRDDEQRDVQIPQGVASWLPAQRHSGENIGDTETHVVFVELKEPTGEPTREPTGGMAGLGPDGS